MLGMIRIESNLYMCANVLISKWIVFKLITNTVMFNIRMRMDIKHIFVYLTAVDFKERLLDTCMSAVVVDDVVVIYDHVQIHLLRLPKKSSHVYFYIIRHQINTHWPKEFVYANNLITSSFRSFESLHHICEKMPLSLLIEV